MCIILQLQQHAGNWFGIFRQPLNYNLDWPATILLGWILQFVGTTVKPQIMHAVRIIYYLDIKEMFNLTSPFDLVITFMFVNKVSRIILVKFCVLGLTKSIINKKVMGVGSIWQ